MYAQYADGSMTQQKVIQIMALNQEQHLKNYPMIGCVLNVELERMILRN